MRDEVPFRLKLRTCRVEAGLSQEELAKEIGVSTPTVWNWENGKGEPTLSQCRMLSDLSGIPIDYMDVSNPKL